jgi:hypothetical protein
MGLQFNKFQPCQCSRSTPFADGPSSIWFRSGVAPFTDLFPFCPDSVAGLRTKFAFRRSSFPSRNSLMLAGEFRLQPCLCHLKIVVTLLPVNRAIARTRAILLGFLILFQATLRNSSNMPSRCALPAAEIPRSQSHRGAAGGGESA